MVISPTSIAKKRLKEIWAQVPPDYYDKGIKNNPFQKIWHNHKLTQVLKFLPKGPSKKLSTIKILDVGCSSAVLTAEIAKALPKSKVIGLDSYKDAILFARKKYPRLSFVVADAHKIPFRNKRFDIVVCTETLEHVVDPKRVLAEIKRVLKKDGRAIISMDSGSFLFKTIWFFWTKTKGKVWESAHLHEFNAKLLEKLIREAGFKIKKKNLSHFGMAVTLLASHKTAKP
ncbi:hypothetical protein A3B51_02435 [Candidatus Curtissbacteria bacterium RIFCSPLOWO2_01_FULL_41_18]|uniref:Methyltransferase type 11 domain-containing protein n=2 Tax=Candidatus Curtissiibacteriota TaxID=1752717 RepID=A0A1F5G079_9BACT|nr:MAG: hypothetical protein A2696_01305 [Candidatus Curtissbacteria bacterium RIFCSPHIGHO2_01_FULL_41_13]OGE04905.1 MAG: hypothetical protein A3B51_02435 [Candidatus Curtissbacteria bacterium RIFCSPLOWO2_01_FULL_41_18]